MTGGGGGTTAAYYEAGSCARGEISACHLENHMPSAKRQLHHRLS